MSLRAKLLILSVIVSLIPLGIAGLTMIGIARDELKSAANDSLVAVANSVSQDIDDFYKDGWLNPLVLIKKAAESETLGVNEKLSLLLEGMKNIKDFAALQISVQGVPSPLMAMQDAFADRLSAAGLSPEAQLKLDPAAALALSRKDPVSMTAIEFLPAVNVWLSTVVLKMDEAAFGRPAALSARINLDRLKNRIERRPFTKTGRITVIDAGGRRIFGADSGDLIGNELVESARKQMAAGNKSVKVEPYARPSGEKMLGAFGFAAVIDLGVIAEKNEADAYMAVTVMVRQLIVWLLVGLLAAVVSAALMSVSLTRPLRRLTRAAGLIAKGDLTIRIDGREKEDEIGALSKAFNIMVDDLRRHIDKLTETTKAKERAESELKLAWDIQKRFLPGEFPAMPAIDVWGTCRPAREVGGDYFDFFHISGDDYGLVIGDVSGKGVSAALFMAVSRTLFRMLSLRNLRPDEVLTEFNDRLVALDQGLNMFITMYYGVYNIRSGRLAYSSAGHNMPFLKSGGNGDRGFSQLPGMKTMVAGIMDGVEMGAGEASLTGGDAIVLYTDGMTEAVNRESEEFGENRLETLLNQYADLSAEEMGRKLIDAVAAHQTGMPQFDDMTVFIMKVK